MTQLFIVAPLENGKLPRYFKDMKLVRVHTNAAGTPTPKGKQEIFNP